MLTFKYKDTNDINKALNTFKILFAYHSNKIENKQINYKDVVVVFDNKILNGSPIEQKTLFEIQNQKECYELLIDKIVNKEKLSEELIKLVHKTITKNTYDSLRYSKGERPGKYKKGDYIVGKAEIGSDAADVENDVKDLLDEINNTNSNDYLTIGAYFHLRFETIHPFADGNGRVGRTLLNYYFMINNIKPLIIYEEDKKLYYECLQAFDNKQDIEPLKKFLSYEQEKTWKKKNNKSLKLSSFL